jgi:hypothetical protein
MFRYFFSCAILLFHSILSFADELVIYISPKGDDGNSGVHISQPKKSIESALEEIVALKTDKDGYLQDYPSFWRIPPALKPST